MKIDEILKELEKNWNYTKEEDYLLVKKGLYLFLIPKGLRFECQKCGNCCHTNRTELSYKDIKRITRYIRKRSDLIEYLKQYNNKFYVKKDDIPLELRIKLPPTETENYMKMIPTKSRKIGETVFKMKCIFLNKENSCMIYKSRTNLCIQYPFGMLPPHLQKELFFSNTKLFRIGFIFEGRVKGFVCNGFFKGKQPLKTLNKLAMIFQRSWNEVIEEMKKKGKF